MFCDNLSENEQEKLAPRFAAALLVPAKVAIHELGAKRRNIGNDQRISCDFLPVNVYVNAVNVLFQRPTGHAQLPLYEPKRDHTTP